jgi:hypothetical protein
MLSYKEKMRVTERFLEEFRFRLADKRRGEDERGGMVYHGDEPSRRSLIGSLGPQPDPLFTGPQPPNSMGMVLLVSPSDSGVIRCRVSGQFDVVHRYIPDISAMQREVIFDNNAPRRGQILAMSFKRMTVRFDELELQFDDTKPGAWLEDDRLAAVLAKETAEYAKDSRVFRRCHTHPNGGAKFDFSWSDQALADQDGLAAAVYREIFQDPTDILKYSVKVRARVRSAPSLFAREGGRRFLLEVYLENTTSRDSTRRYGIEFPYLLDTHLQVQMTGGRVHRVPHRLQPEDYKYQDADGLPGYGVSCSVDEVNADTFRSNSLPTAAQVRIDAPLPGDVGMSDAPHYDALSRDPIPILEGFIKALDRYAERWVERIEALTREGKHAERDIATEERSSFTREIGRIRDGYELLKGHDELRRSFQWMNESMLAAVRLQGKSFTGWHLFQLGFILTQVRSIFERHCSPAALKGSMELADVLWFATGGGKTEAYLGILSMALLYGRLKGRTHGTTAWMRFPLRMLSVQQFQRLSYVLAQCNIIRQREGLQGWPFTIGYFTGEGTPGTISDASPDRASTFLPTLSDEQIRSYLFIVDCPYCGQRNSIELIRDFPNARLKHVCRNAGCWSNTIADSGIVGEGIRGEVGIFVSDEEIYRYIPSVLIGTVDKLAVVAHNKRFANFMGAARFFCPAHGFTRSTKCEHRRIEPQGDRFETLACDKNTRHGRARVVPVEPMSDPGFAFLIQDELHLLRESLGNFDAHYESLLNALQIAHGGRSPKNLAATATIKDFEDHVHHLYLKGASRFPAPGVDQGESFYARRVVDAESRTPLIRRWFCGLLPIGRGNMAMQSVAEISSRFLDQVDEWRSALKSRDTSRISMLELGAISSEAVLGYIEKNLNTDLVYVNRKRSISEVLRFLEEINGRNACDRGFRQLDGETPLDDILAAIHHVESKGPEDITRHLIATSVVSHGVDIAELNFMVMAGWPRSTAEYIQASARSGRVHPGIVISVLNARQLFETNVFLNFVDFHFFIEKLVDSVPINRFAPNVLDRTLPGIFSAVLLNWAPQQLWGAKLGVGVKPLVECLKGPQGRQVCTEIGSVVGSSLRLSRGMESKFDPRIVASFNRALDVRIGEVLHRLEHLPASKNDQLVTEAIGDILGHAPMRSFRDIENQILIQPAGTTIENVLDALAR